MSKLLSFFFVALLGYGCSLGDPGRDPNPAGIEIQTQQEHYVLGQIVTVSVANLSQTQKRVVPIHACMGGLQQKHSTDWKSVVITSEYAAQVCSKIRLGLLTVAPGEVQEASFELAAVDLTPNGLPALFRLAVGILDEEGEQEAVYSNTFSILRADR